MNKVLSLESLNELIKKYFIKNTLTNNYVLAETYKKFIELGKLYTIEGKQNAIVLLDETNFYKLYFFINDLTEMFPISIDKPITMEVIYRGPSNKPIEIFNYWERNGFKLHLTRDNLSLTYKNLKQVELKNSNVKLKYAETIEEADAIKQLFDSSLDKYTGDLLSVEHIMRFIKNKNIICAYIENNFCGALQFEIKNNIIWLGHIVTDHNYRGNSIGNYLVKKYIEDNASASNSRYQLWVIDDNIAATSLYRKFGFIYSNKSTTSLIKL